MSAPATDSKLPAVVERKPLELFGKKQRKYAIDPLSDNNPITVQVLGICSALAVTVAMNTALVMTIAVIFVLVSSNVVVSLLRNYIPPAIRIIVMLSVVAVSLKKVDQVLKAFLFDISKQLSVFVGLIITNCIILGRAEAFAMANKPWPSFLDGLGNGMGHGIILLLVAAGRETLGSGAFFGFKIVPQFVYDAGYTDVGLMVLAPGAFILLGLLIWAQRAFSGYVED
jgi:Na+-transporting NADH:ubiquinone oxidoreductase subunit D